MTNDYDDSNEISTLDGDLWIGDFLVRPLLKKVVRLDADGEHVEEHSLPDKAMGVLVYLAEHSRQVCERDDILDAVWGEDREAYDRVLDTAIAEIRRGFGDDARSPSYVQTVPKRGYRLLQGPVDPTDRGLDPQYDGSPNQEKPNQETNTSRRQERYGLRYSLLGILIASLAGAYWLGSTSGSPAVTAKLNTPAGPQTTLISSELIQEKLFRDHPCASDSLLGRPALFRSPDLVINLSEHVDGEDGSILSASARVESSLSKEIEFARTSVATTQDPELVAQTASVFADSTRRATDRLLCRLEGLPAAPTACHCLHAASSSTANEDRPADTIELLRRAISLDPDSMSAYRQLATAYLRMGDRENEIATIHRGLARLDSLDSTIGLELRSSLALSNNDFEEYSLLLKELARREPKNWSRVVDIARFETIHLGMCNRSLNVLTGLDKEHPNEVPILIELSRANRWCGNRDRCLEILQQLLIQHPRNPNVRRAYIAAHAYDGELDAAEKAAKELFVLRPSDPFSYVALGGVATHRGAYTEARNWLEKALDMARWPVDKSRSYGFLGEIAWRLGKFDECISLNEQATAFARPGDFTFSAYKGICLEQSGRHGEAQELLDQLWNAYESINDQTRSCEILFLQGWLEANESIEKATDTLRQALNLCKGHADVAALGGMIHEGVGDLETAREFYQHRLSFSPRDPWILCRHGLLDRRQGDNDSAIDHLRRAIDVFGNPPEDPLGMQCAEALAELDPTFTVAN